MYPRLQGTSSSENRDCHKRSEAKTWLYLLSRPQHSEDVPVPAFRSKGLTPTFVQCNETNAVVCPGRTRHYMP